LSVELIKTVICIDLREEVSHGLILYFSFPFSQALNVGSFQVKTLHKKWTVLFRAFPNSLRFRIKKSESFQMIQKLKTRNKLNESCAMHCTSEYK